jgi:hypothetical protein
MPVNDPPPAVCPSSPASDNIGTACSRCGHTGHWPGPCRECVMDIKIKQLDELMAQVRAELDRLRGPR